MSARNDPACHSVAASSWRATASSAGATSTRTPCTWSCGSCPPASSADTAARTPLLRNMPTISSASVRLGTAVMGTVAPSGRSGEYAHAPVRPALVLARDLTLPRIGCRGICQCRRFNTDIGMTLGAPCDLSTTGVPERLSRPSSPRRGPLAPFRCAFGPGFFRPAGSPSGQEGGEQHDRGGQPAGDPDPG